MTFRCSMIFEKNWKIGKKIEQCQSLFLQFEDGQEGYIQNKSISWGLLYCHSETPPMEDVHKRPHVCQLASTLQAACKANM